MFFIHKETKW